MSQAFDISSKRTDIIENKDGLINPFVYERFDICPFCKSQSIGLISFNGIEQQYRKAVDEYFRGFNVNFNRYEIHAMRCSSCGHEFVIDWTNGFPRPLRNSAITNIFFDEFMRGI